MSSITLELEADNVWSPQIFSVAWGSLATEGGIQWQAPLQLPTHAPLPLTVQIISLGSESGSAATEVWLVGAVWPDGRSIPVDDFQTDAGWEQREISWGSYENKPIWMTRQRQPAKMSWSGSATGPLTLIFAKHNQAGQVTIHWNEQSQTLDLAAPAVEFQGVSLPLSPPYNWRAELPLNALGDDISILIEPDPGGGFPATLKQISLSGVPGYTPVASGDQLQKALRLEGGVAQATETGLRVDTKRSTQPPRLTLTSTFIPRIAWSWLIPPLENGLLILYGAVVGGLIFAYAGRSIPSPILINVNILLVTILIAVGVGEVLLRRYLPSPDGYFVWPPQMHAIFQPNPTALPGISGESNFLVNSQGIRGDEVSAEVDYRILTVGGSTTESLYLDQTEAWPHLVQTGLNMASKNQQVWVGNVGKSGLNTRENLLQMEVLLPQHPEIDAVILLVGGNDFNLRLIEGDSYKPNYLSLSGTREKLLQRAFNILPTRDPDLHRYQLSAAWRLLNRAERVRARPETVNEIDAEDEAGEVYIARRERRKQAVLEGRIEENLPDLSSSLSEYRQNLNHIVDVAEAHQVRLILMTQPTLWRSDLTVAEEDLLWLGWQPGYANFYTPNALSQGMELYNQSLLEMCELRQLECIDLAAAISKSNAIFYDGVHFNEVGSQQVATVVTEYLLRHPPFDGAD